MGMNEASGTLMAIKSMSIINAESGDIVDLQREIDVMRTLSHPNIVRYFGAELNEEEGMLNIFQEWVPGGSVSSLLTKFGRFPPPVVRSYLKQVSAPRTRRRTAGYLWRRAMRRRARRRNDRRERAVPSDGLRTAGSERSAQYDWL